MEQILNNSVVTKNFSRTYPFINKYLCENGNNESSRNGDTIEILNFKTEILNPYKRLVGNNRRNINVFFLMAEAMWIFNGRKDVEFLELFNANMKQFSDDGVSFNAPYGFRIRHHGVSSFEDFSKLKLNEENMHYVEQTMTGEDQLISVLRMLSEDPQSRRAVISIWNPDFDLARNSKDLPCNDLLMFKIRGGKLHTTISNRSNDLHWGLPTNVFQFSFLTEIMSEILQVELGTQTHNSQSLHFYTDNDIAANMYDELQLNPTREFIDLYDTFETRRIDLNFRSATTVGGKLQMVDHYLLKIMNSLLQDSPMSYNELKELNLFSKTLFYYYKLLSVYVSYKNGKKNDEERLARMREIEEISKNEEMLKTDVYAMAMNFFIARLSDEKRVNFKTLGNF